MQLSARVDFDMVERLDELTVSLSRPGLELGRADVMRMALAEGVEVLAKRAADEKRRK